MEKGMEEPYIEGVATHGGPESCVGVREGLLSREIKEFGVPTPSKQAEGNIAGGVMRESPGDPARSENLCVYGIFMRENREIPRSPAGVMAGRAAQGTLRR
jgi:RNA-directed DNA polymerase